MLDGKISNGHNEQTGMVGQFRHRWPSRDRVFMAEFLQSPAAHAIILFAVLAALIAVGIYVILRVRQSMRETGPTASELISNFREMHAQGKLDDEEFREIKSMLSQRLKQELNGNDQAG